MRDFPAFRMFFTFEHVNQPAIGAGHVDVRENMIPAEGPPASFLAEIEDSLPKQISIPVKGLCIHEWHVRSDCHRSTVSIHHERIPYAVDPRSPD